MDKKSKIVNGITNLNVSQCKIELLQYTMHCKKWIMFLNTGTYNEHKCGYTYW